MKLSHDELTGKRNARKEAESCPGPLRKAFLNAALIGAVALSSQVGMVGSARAQPVPEQGQPVPVETAAPAEVPAPPVPTAAPIAQPAAQQYTAEGNAVQVADPNGSHNVYSVSSQRGFAPRISVEGPCRLTVRFYPAVLGERFPSPESEFARQISYTLGPQGGQQAAGSFSGVTRSSQYTSADIASNSGLVVGSPIETTIQVPAGRNVLTVTAPNGLLEVVRVERLPATPVARPVQPAQPRPIQPPVQAPAEPSEESLRPAFTFEGSRTPLRGLGTADNRGDIYAAEALGYIRLSESLSLLVGGMFTTYGLAMTAPQAETSLRSYSGDLAAGLAYQNGAHFLYGLGYGGYRGIQTSVLSIADGRTLEELSSGFEYGGRAGYRYSDVFGVQVQGGNNPFNPLSARVFGALPRTLTWAEGVSPYVEADFLWLHTLRPAGTPGFVGLTSLDENSFHVRALAGIPVYRLGPFVPIAIAGGEFNISGGSVTSGTGIFGGGVRTFFTRGLDLEAFGAATLHGDPLVLLRLGYRM